MMQSMAGIIAVVSAVMIMLTFYCLNLGDASSSVNPVCSHNGWLTNVCNNKG